MLHVCFPSSWRPERLLGASFSEIHQPVPGFAKNERAEQSMIKAMIDHGPYVRFVWTLSADDYLDHHPVFGESNNQNACAALPAPITQWQTASQGWLRVERQVSVGFPKLNAAVFLIRVYVYSFAQLSTRRRQTLANAVASMPEDIARYKAIAGHRKTILSLLSR